MKIIKYSMCAVIDGEEVLTPVEMGWNEVNEETAKGEAYNGEYIIEDDGKPEPVPQPSPDQRFVELEGALALLLSGVTE